MVEILMIFALGFVAATLIALLVIPAINARAERLARRRAEALFPMSISELTAEKDHLRAEFAIQQRRIERKAEEALAFKQQSMEELGRQAIRIETLEGVVAERDQTIALLEATLAETQERLNATEEQLAETKMQLSGSRETLTALESAHGATLDELASLRMEFELAQKERMETRSGQLLAEEQLAQLETEYADMDRRLTAALTDLDAKRITISDLETRLMMQTGRGDDFERALGERHTELSDERQRLTDLATDLIAEQERGLMLAQRIRELEAERDEARSRLAELENREAGNEELRSRITEVADQIISSGQSKNNKSQNGKQRRSAAR